MRLYFVHPAHLRAGVFGRDSLQTMKSSPELDADTKALLAQLRSFVVSPIRRPASADGHHPGFTNVIRPLLAAASEAFAWPPKSKRDPVAYPPEILIPERGRYRLDLSRDAIAGNESFWHATAGRRGSIAIRLPLLPADMVQIFRHCSRLPGCDEPAVLSSRYQLSKSDSPGAIRYCDDVIDGDEYAFLFSATNGIEYMSVFARAEELEKLYQLAAEECPAHQRWRPDES